jgi:cyclophilin family peptidyl-prolyl cis-trans isomerase/HEAT repeat protein
MERRTQWGILLLAASASLGVGCAGGPSAPTAAPTPPPVKKTFASALEARAALLGVEDRRVLDAAVLEGAASFSDPAIRSAAALAMGRLEDEKVEPWLEPLLKDPDGSVRASAAVSCQLLGDRAETPNLIPLLADPDPAAASAAAGALGYLQRGDGEDALVAAIPKTSSPEPRASMIRALWRFGDSATVAAAVAYVHDPDVAVRRAAVFALARQPVEAALPSLESAIDDSDPDTAALAAAGLGVLGRKEALSPVLGALDTGKTPLTVNALTALDQILSHNPGSTIPPEKVARIVALSQDADPNVALAALWALRQVIADPAYKDAFQRVWQTAVAGTGRRREIALEAAASALRERARPAIDRAAASEEESLRGAAALSLAFLSNEAAAPYRSQLIGDPAALVRMDVILAIAGAAQIQANKPLVERALADSDVAVRTAAIEKLMELKDPAWLPEFRQSLTRSRADHSAEAGLAAVVAAAQFFGNPDARAILEDARTHPLKDVARRARRSLILYFREPESSLPEITYDTGRTAADYQAILQETARPWTATVDCGPRGSFVIQLDGRDAPLTVENFLDLSRKGFFDGSIFHRVVPNFVVQGGDPTRTGSGGPGYEIRGENNARPFVRGAVGMALSFGDIDSAGSQFFVTMSPARHLDVAYTNFGSVISGSDVVERLEQGDRIAKVTVRAGGAN